MRTDRGIAVSAPRRLQWGISQPPLVRAAPRLVAVAVAGRAERRRCGGGGGPIGCWRHCRIGRLRRLECYDGVAQAAPSFGLALQVERLKPETALQELLGADRE